MKKEQEKDLPSSNFVVRIDSKGRVSLPAEIRRSFGLSAQDKIELYVSLSERKIILVLNGVSDDSDSSERGEEDG